MEYAKAHGALVDMIYPYISRLLSTSLAQWSGGVTFCVWQAVLLALVIGCIVTAVLMILLRWNFFQWFGWVLTVVSALFLLHTGIYGLNEYAGPLADDIRLDVSDYTVTELNEAACYFRDKANNLAGQIARNKDGDPEYSDFSTLAIQAADGFKALTYEQAISVFSGSTAPVKELGWKSLYAASDTYSKTFPLTGEAAVNPDIPDVALPFVMCKEMSRRMTIVGEEDARFAAYLACTANASIEFQYSAYCIAYYYCYSALADIPTSTAKSCAKKTDAGVSKYLRNDLQIYEDFFGEYTVTVSEEESTAAELLTCWYIQNFITPLHVQEEAPFNPEDPNQVDLEGIVNAEAVGNA
jgi:hypothetical protein